MMEDDGLYLVDSIMKEHKGVNQGILDMGLVIRSRMVKVRLDSLSHSVRDLAGRGVLALADPRTRAG